METLQRYWASLHKSRRKRKEAQNERFGEIWYNKESNPNNNYTQGHSNYTVATHLTRTAESDAAFLLPHIKKTDHILGVGCGPGSITTGLTKYAGEGATVGIRISPDVLQKARTVAAEAGVSSKGAGSVVFQEANVLERLPYADVDGGKVRTGAGTMVFSGPETRKWLAWRAAG
ncbi:uncharacterized protein A1O5_04935 [Cladophialophora psammophila CBS 110553]|uniref:Methyltransferase domain-containing protein n=1 Tax=Cladophialophora psammophila CBS 110553 TaxID=1182543 RepID=W9X697_9EURO|nr:uncharacterized protein A1O5_04935 [Cladophialophora psammophila CBS 110553]EXJ72431.1 hypothetical protein A1O5_04935 [Cladophialophora psammophila CBS 110553]